MFHNIPPVIEDVTWMPLVNWGSCSTDSGPVPHLEPVFSVSPDKELALSQQMWFQGGTRSHNPLMSGAGDGVTCTPVTCEEETDTKQTDSLLMSIFRKTGQIFFREKWSHYFRKQFWNIFSHPTISCREREQTVGAATQGLWPVYFFNVLNRCVYY